jgi:heptosyltransferase-2
MERFPNSQIHFFLRKGNESVIQGLPTVHKVWVWDKQGGKARNLLRLILELRSIRFDMVFNLHRHFNSGLVSALMKSPFKAGFSQNPLSFFYTHKVNHLIPHKSLSGNWHEVQRNLQLLQKADPTLEIVDNSKNYKPELPLQDKHREKIAPHAQGEYFVVAPASVWFTKAWSEHKYRELTHKLAERGRVLFIGAPASVWFTKAWSEHKYRELTHKLAERGRVLFIGAPTDKELCDRIRYGIPNTENLCGQLNLLDSAALMKNAKRVFVNDSAPLHLASCVNARTTAIFCSTVPEFGYTPLADDSVVIDVGNSLSCRPCGLHGYKACPLGHFKCAESINVQKVLATI